MKHTGSYQVSVERNGWLCNGCSSIKFKNDGKKCTFCGCKVFFGGVEVLIAAKALTKEETQKCRDFIHQLLAHRAALRDITSKKISYTRRHHNARGT